MPIYTLISKEFFIPERSVLLDTNILFTAFMRNDRRCEDTRVFIDEILRDMNYSPIVLLEVVVETWGLVVGSRKEKNSGLEMLSWLSNPANATLIPLESNLFHLGHDLCHRMGIDYVDSILINSSFELSKQCSIRKPLPIVTYERREYYDFMARTKREIELISPDDI